MAFTEVVSGTVEEHGFKPCGAPTMRFDFWL